MLEGIFYGIAAALVFLGLVCVVYIIMTRIFKTDCCGKLIVVLSPDKESCDIGALLYAAHLRLSIWGDCCNGRIIVVDNGLDKKQLDLCKRIMSECGSMELCKSSDIAQLLTGKEQ